MDKKIEILLGSRKNINSVNTESYTRVELSNQTTEIMEFNINDVVDSTQVFDDERQGMPIYRIYGRIEYLSLLNGVSQGHNSLEDFFNPIYTGNSKNILNSFDFYLVAPHPTDPYTAIPGTNKRQRSFVVIASKDDFEIYPAGFTNNLYGEQVYAFSFKSDFDVSNYFDSLGFPITELFLYAQYIKHSPITEQMSYTAWSYGGTLAKQTLTTKDLVVGDDVEIYAGTNIHDIIEYQEKEYVQTQVEPQIFYIRTRYNDGGPQWLEWSYNPFIPIQLRYLSDDLDSIKANQIIANTSFLNVSLVSNPTAKLNATKSLAQTVTPTLNNISNWDDNYTGTTYNWYPSSGEVEFTIPATIVYNISFKTEIYLTQDSDKYMVQTSVQEDIGSGWDEIPNTKRTYFPPNPPQSVNITRSYTYGNKLRTRVKLIPNPGERKVERIPDYATLLETEGQYIWREINPQGYVEPLTGVGVNYPFFNGRRYLFEPIVFTVIPNLSEDPVLEHPNTLAVFNEISFSDNATTLDTTPTKNDLNNVDKPCQ